MFLEQLRTNFDNSVHNCAVSVGSTDPFFNDHLAKKIQRQSSIISGLMSTIRL